MPWRWKDGEPVAWVDAELGPDEQPAPVSGPPMQAPGWVDDFLRGPTKNLPFRVTIRPPGGRRGYRRARRRG